MHLARGGLADPIVLQGTALGLEDRLLEAGEAADARRLGQRLHCARPDTDPAAVSAGGVDRGLQRQLQQSVAIQPGGEGLADAPDPTEHARALLLELLEPALELARHAVELLAEGGELVTSGGVDG